VQPNRIDVLDTLGWVYHKMGKTDEALEIYEVLVAEAPDNPGLNYHLGMVLLDANRKEEAAENFRIAVESKQPFSGKAAAEKQLKELAKSG
jgi:tetratricopeptide (TPR) repeat protein